MGNSALTTSVDPRLEIAAKEFVRTRNIKRACAVAGLPPSSQSAMVFRRHPQLAELVSKHMEEQFAEVELTATDVLMEIKRVAFQRIDDILDPVTGAPLPLHELSDDAAATIVAVDHETRWEGKGEGATPITVTKIRRADKMAALGLLAKHFKIVGDEGDGVNALASALAERLRNGRKRAFAEAADVEDATPIPPRAVVDSSTIASEPLPAYPAPAGAPHEDLF